jgi:hypothetical protein
MPITLYSYCSMSVKPVYILRHQSFGATCGCVTQLIMSMHNRGLQISTARSIERNDDCTAIFCIMKQLISFISIVPLVAGHGFVQNATIGGREYDVHTWT